MLDAVRHIVDRVQLDFLNVSHSAYLVGDSDSLSPQVADMYYPPAPYRHFPKLFREEVAGVPVIGVCRVDSLELAEELLAGGFCDIVAMTRAHIADPDILRKWRDGNADLIQRCVACNQGCVGNLELGRPITCVVNPRVGKEGGEDHYAALLRTVERQLSPRAHSSHRVLVVGAGPAGLEAAVCAREKGFGVTLHERASEVGGQLRLAAAMEGRALWRRFVEDCLAHARRLGLEIRCNSEVAAQDIQEGQWDHVVIATGSTPRRYVLEGHGPVLTVEEVLSDEASLGMQSPARIVLIDDHGGWPGIGMAYHLAMQGHRVSIVSAGEGLGPLVTMYSKLGHLHRLGARGVRTHLLRRAVRRTGRRVELVDVVSGAAEVLEPVDKLVWVGPRRADDALAGALAATGYQGGVQVIGDAYAPRSVLEAVREGRRAAERLLLG